jgi:hypothetical protein
MQKARASEPRPRHGWRPVGRSVPGQRQARNARADEGAVSVRRVVGAALALADAWYPSLLTRAPGNAREPRARAVAMGEESGTSPSLLVNPLGDPCYLRMRS